MKQISVACVLVESTIPLGLEATSWDLCILHKGSPALLNTQSTSVCLSICPFTPPHLHVTQYTQALSTESDDRLCDVRWLQDLKALQRFSWVWRASMEGFL